MRDERRLLLVAACAGALLLTGTTPATAAELQCTNGAAIECQHVKVPLDRAAATTRSLKIYAERFGDEARREDALVYLSGGPGQAATTDASQFASLFKPLLDTRAVVTFDVRGTGRSTPLACPGLADPPGVRAVAACARRLGIAARFHRTSDSVADLDAVLDAFGVKHATLFGVSYGTRLALEYAAARPERTAGLILDSPVPLGGLDAFGASRFVAAGRVLGKLCSPGRCKAAGVDPRGDLERLVKRWKGRSVPGVVFTKRGRALRRPISANDVLQYLQAGDFSPRARVLLPGPLRAALRGDTAPLTRLIDDVFNRRAPNPTGLSQAVNLATLCGETAMPWNAAESPARRLSHARTRALALPEMTLRPFDASTALQSYAITTCTAWPWTVATVTAPKPPSTRTLILSGTEDVRTPSADARRLAAALPKATLLSVGGVGHAVVGNDVTSCARDAVKAFVVGGPIAKRCPGLGRSDTEIAGPPPRYLSEVGRNSSAGRLAKAVALTLADTISRTGTLTIDVNGSGTGITRSGGGLRGGWVLVDGPRYELHALRYLSDVQVSGVFDQSTPVSAFTVRGPGGVRARATLLRRQARLVLRTGRTVARESVPGGLAWRP